MRISDWSSDVCSSDLYDAGALRQTPDRCQKCFVVNSLVRHQPKAGQGPFSGASGLSAHHCSAYSSRHDQRSEEHTSELQSLMRISYAVFCLKKKKNKNNTKKHDVNKNNS